MLTREPVWIPPQKGKVSTAQGHGHVHVAGGAGHHAAAGALDVLLKPNESRGRDEEIKRKPRT